MKPKPHLESLFSFALCFKAANVVSQADLFHPPLLPALFRRHRSPLPGDSEAAPPPPSMVTRGVVLGPELGGGDPGPS